MAEKAEFLQAIDDAILDADSLEKFINGDDTQDVLTRLSKRYPTLQKAIKELFENGGLPATPFKTYALMTASSLPNDSYAVVTNDTDDAKNRMYTKTDGAWTVSKYDPLTQAKADATIKADAAQTQAISTAKDYTDTEVAGVEGSLVNRLESSKAQLGLFAQKAAASGIYPQTPKPISPESYFGDNLLNYFDNQSVGFNASGEEIVRGAVATTLSSGRYPLATITNGSIETFVGEGLVEYKYIQASSNTTFYQVNHPSEMAEALTRADSFLFWTVGNISFSKNEDSTLFNTGELRLVSSRDNTISGLPAVLRLQERSDVDSTWITKIEWNMSFDAEVAGDGRLSVVGKEYPWLAIEILSKSGEARLYINGTEHEPVIKSVITVKVTSNLVQDLFYVYSPTYPTRMVASAFVVNTPIESVRVLNDYISRPLYKLPAIYNLSGTSKSKLGVDRFYPNTNPTSTTLLGGYNIKGAQHLSQSFTEGSAVKGNLPDFTIPSAPNVSPWDMPHDRYLIDGSVTRLSAMPHPDFIGDTSKVLLMANSAAFLDNAAGTIHMCAYESSDGGQSFTRKAVATPGIKLPPLTTSTVNNIVVANQYGRYIYLGDHFPNGYTPSGFSESFKYFFISETYGRIYACRDIFKFSTYEIVSINKHSIPPFREDGTVYETDLTRPNMPNKAGLESISEGCEEKILGYDPISDRFYRILKVNMPPTDYPADGSTSHYAYSARNLMISWSEKGDMTRWGGYEMLLPARRQHYQAYDAEVIQVRPYYWLLLVFRYTVITKNQDIAETQYVEQAQKMDVDLYVSTDQFKTPPVLLREGWIPNNQQEWASGTLWAFKHPYDKDKIYVNGADGLHGGKRPEGASYSDYKWKVALVDYEQPTYATPDGVELTGSLFTRLMDGSKLDKFRLVKGEGFMQVRVLDSNGDVVSGMDFSDFAIDSSSEIIAWNGVKKPPNRLIQLEIRANGTVFAGLYPMNEHYRFF